MSVCFESSKSMLLHSCCAVCASSCAKRLRDEGWNVTLFYDNPNIQPEEEREKRLENVRILAKAYGMRLVVGHTRNSVWADAVKGFEKEKEGGKRCERCFELNLSIASEMAKREGIGAFCTSLTVSRHKNSKMILDIGAGFAEFVPYDFKKKGGEAESNRLAREMGLYRQNYCGCVFSMRGSQEERKQNG